MNKILNLQPGFPSTDTSWKDKTSVIATETVRIVTNLSKPFFQIQSKFIASNQKQMIFILRRPWSSEKKSLYSKVLVKFSPRTQKLYQITCIFCNLSNLLSFIPFILTDWHLQKPLGCSEFAEPNCLFKRYVYIVAYLGIILQASWHIPEGN